MIIGLEGCDGTGKSTLAEAVAAELQRRVDDGSLPKYPVKLIHHGPPQKNVLEEYATDIEGQDDVHWVFDRHHLGTLVYAPLYRATGPYGELGVAGFRWVEKFLQARGASFYVVDLPYPTVAARLEARGEDYLESHHVEGVLKRFREVSGLSVLADVFVPPEGMQFVSAAAKVIVDDALEHAAEHTALRAFPSYVGGVHPTVLLVGEKRGGKPPFGTRACFAPVKNRSGAYLWDALPDPFWRGVGVANACEGDNLIDLWSRINTPPVVALGREASKALDKARIPHAGVPHPQYVKRFHNSKQKQYGELIASVVASGEQRFTWPA